ncbi:MAG: hypothetical protein U9N01_04405 [Euryarchaeota archaeon]|nr:hypothetical protein [Euryarchaeota archaeon]
MREHEIGEVPYCCGEPMTSIYRYRAKDGLYRTYLCENCRNKREVKDT